MSAMHLSLDLETLGKVPGSVILSIGAVAFDPVSGVVREPFYANLQRVPQLNVGMRTDPDTIAWWARQSQQAQDRLEVDPQDPAKALERFVAYWNSYGCRLIWGHGAGFDVTLIEELFRSWGLPFPWRFHDVRDTRTLFDVAGVGVRRDKGLHHDAADDAVNQAEAVIRAYRALGLSGSPPRRWIARQLRRAGR